MLQTSGRITMNDIVVEMGFPSKTPMSLKLQDITVSGLTQRQVWINGAWRNLNMCSPTIPKITKPFAIKDWYGYNHTYHCCRDVDLQWFPGAMYNEPRSGGAEVYIQLAVKGLPIPPNQTGYIIEFWSDGVWNDAFYYHPNNVFVAWATTFPNNGSWHTYLVRKKGCTKTLSITIQHIATGGGGTGSVPTGANCPLLQWGNSAVIDNGVAGYCDLVARVVDVGLPIKYRVNGGAWVSGSINNLTHRISQLANGASYLFEAVVDGCTNSISGYLSATIGTGDTGGGDTGGGTPTPPTGTVFQNTYFSQYVQRNNCPSGQNGSSVLVEVARGTFTSTTSQQHADDQATAYAQNQANSLGTCSIETVTYYSSAINRQIRRNNCPSGETGSLVTVNIGAGAYTSTISQTDADTQANNAAQAQANANGTCSVITTCTPVSNVSFGLAKTFFSNNSDGMDLIMTGTNIVNVTSVTVGIINIFTNETRSKTFTVTSEIGSGNTSLVLGLADLVYASGYWKVQYAAATSCNLTNIYNLVGQDLNIYRSDISIGINVNDSVQNVLTTFNNFDPYKESTYSWSIVGFSGDQTRTISIVPSTFLNTGGNFTYSLLDLYFSRIGGAAFSISITIKCIVTVGSKGSKEMNITFGVTKPAGP